MTMVEIGMRVEVVSGFYAGHRGDVIARIYGRWRVRLDQAGKIAFIDEQDMKPEA